MEKLAAMVAMSCKTLSLRQNMMETRVALSLMLKASQPLRRVFAGSADSAKGKTSQLRQKMLVMLRPLLRSLQRTRMSSRSLKSSVC